MDRNLVISITESFQKEIEHYQLDKIGFIQNTRAETDYLIKHILVEAEIPQITDIESYRQWRLTVFGNYYRKKEFASFVRAHIHQSSFSKMIFNLLSTLLAQRFTRLPETDSDHFLAPTGKTVSWLLCEEEFLKLYSQHFHENIRIENTEKLYLYCQHIIVQTFPLSTAEILTCLSNDYKAFWENVCLRLKNLTESVTKTVIQPYRYDAIHDIWTETCFELKKAIQNGNLPLTADAQGVYAYTRGIVRNKVRAFFRVQKKEAWLVIKDWDQEPSLQNSEEYSDDIKDTPSMEEFLDLTDINSEDEYEIRKALAYALYNQDHPYHKQLTEGLEDKVEVLVTHYVKKLSYEEIAFEKFGEQSPEDLKRETDKLRQDVSRVKTKIKERFKKLLDSNK